MDLGGGTDCVRCEQKACQRRESESETQDLRKSPMQRMTPGRTKRRERERIERHLSPNTLPLPVGLLGFTARPSVPLVVDERADYPYKVTIQSPSPN